MNLVPKQVYDAVSQTDGIVVLTGGTHRLNQGLELMEDQRATKMLISGVYHGVELQEILNLFKRSPQELECCIDIGHDADNTRGNAIETKQWITQNSFQSLRLVTANYHMPRSLLEFEYLMPDVQVIAHPVFPEHVKVDQWWRWPGTALLLISEYNKYLLVHFRQILANNTSLEF